MLAICHAVLVKEVTSNYELDPSFDVEASKIYPKVKYNTADNCLKSFVLDLWKCVVASKLLNKFKLKKIG